MADNLLVVRGLKQYYPVKGGLGKETSYVKAVDNVDFEVRRGEIFGIVGEVRMRKVYPWKKYLQADRSDGWLHRAGW